MKPALFTNCSTAMTASLLRRASTRLSRVLTGGLALGGSSQLTVSLARTNVALVLPRAVRPSTSAILKYASGARVSTRKAPPPHRCGGVHKLAVPYSARRGPRYPTQILHPPFPRRAETRLFQSS